MYILYEYMDPYVNGFGTELRVNAAMVFSVVV